MVDARVPAVLMSTTTGSLPRPPRATLSATTSAWARSIRTFALEADGRDGLAHAHADELGAHGEPVGGQREPGALDGDGDDGDLCLEREHERALLEGRDDACA